MSRCSCYVFTEARASITSLRLPHSEISGSQRVYRSPKLIAVSHVLHRLLAPRHPSCALCSLINLFRSPRSAGPDIFMITETLWLKILTSSRLFQTQLLKVVFTTLYVDVKEPAASNISVDKKTQPCLSDSNHVAVIRPGQN